ncbi:MAG: hypothetical protein HZB46_00800 [Solirubrobacterales bacterium]|nr:hypothetical protein [Solirubrobacterales bacterium]
MSTLGLILIILGAVLLVLFVGGMIAVSRRRKATESRFREQVEAANAALARAHAEDKGWERATMEAAAREAAAGPVDELHLLEVVDKPGTDADEAVFRAVTGGQERLIRLGRREGAWIPL